jgi:hypothetical protein
MTPKFSRISKQLKFIFIWLTLFRNDFLDLIKQG